MRLKALKVAKWIEREEERDEKLSFECSCEVSLWAGRYSLTNEGYWRLCWVLRMFGSRKRSLKGWKVNEFLQSVFPQFQICWGGL